MKANPRVCFQVDEHRLVPSLTPCNFTMHYRSILMFGRVRFLADPKEKLKILKIMVDKYSSAKLAKPLDEAMTHQVEVGEITLEEISGKRRDRGSPYLFLNLFYRFFKDFHCFINVFHFDRQWRLDSYHVCPETSDSHYEPIVST